MQQIGDDGKQRCFLPAMLRRAGTEGRANLSIQRSACPKTSGLVQKGGHLRRYPAIARTCADDDGVIVRKFLDSCYGRFLIQLERSEEHTSELQSLMRISYAVFCLKKKNKSTTRMITYPSTS